MPKTDQERIAELERRVDDLEEEAVFFRSEMGTVLRLKLDAILRILNADEDEIELGNTLSLGLGGGGKRDPVEILGGLGLPPVEKRAGRVRKGAGGDE